MSDQSTAAADKGAAGSGDGISADAGGRSARIKMAATGLAILVFAVIGGILVHQFTEAEREREMRRWQVRLGIIADSRFADIDTWMDAQVDELRGLAENESLQLYMTILYDVAGGADSAASAELEYLGNLLAVVADRTGFTAAVSGPAVAANVNRVGSAGIAIVDEEGNIVVASPGTPPVQGQIRSFIENTPKGEAAVSDMFIGPGGKPAMAFLAPVFALQSDESASSQIATVVGIKPVTDELFPLLEQPGNVDQTAEAVLVRQAGATVEYISPLMNGSAPLKLKLSTDTPDLAAAWAIRTPGGFAVKKDYAGAEVLALSRAFPQVPWTLVYKIGTSEALAESEDRLNQMVIAFSGIIVLVLIGGVALWYYGTSQRAQQAADRFEHLASRFEAQRNFMHVVTDSQPNSIAIYDEGGHFRWFNEMAMKQARMDRAGLLNKHVSAIFGPIHGKRIAGWVKECIETREHQSHTHEMNLGEGERVFRSDLIHLPPSEGMPNGALVVTQDITESVREREKREQVMQQLVNTLVSVVDQRDPFSANHSVRVGVVARAIASEMAQDPLLIETSGTAGSLMNLGKITVPTHVLTKEGKLTEEEFKMIRDSVMVSANLVRNVDFEGPVADTLAQMQENYDGTGTPEGLKGEDIIVTSRIVSVANAFVGMVSARAWRDGMPFEAAIDQLLHDGNKKFDRRVVVALANHLDNHGGKEAWADFGTRPRS